MAGIDIPGAGRISNHGMPVPDRLSCPEVACTLTVAIIRQGSVGYSEADIFDCAQHHGPFFRDGAGTFQPWTDPDDDAEIEDAKDSD